MSVKCPAPASWAQRQLCRERDTPSVAPANDGKNRGFYARPILDPATQQQIIRRTAVILGIAAALFVAAPAAGVGQVDAPPGSSAIGALLR